MYTYPWNEQKQHNKQKYKNIWKHFCQIDEDTSIIRLTLIYLLNITFGRAKPNGQTKGGHLYKLDPS